MLLLAARCVRDLQSVGAALFMDSLLRRILRGHSMCCILAVRPMPRTLHSPMNPQRWILERERMQCSLMNFTTERKLHSCLTSSTMFLKVLPSQRLYCTLSLAPRRFICHVFLQLCSEPCRIHSRMVFENRIDASKKYGRNNKKGRSK